MDAIGHAAAEEEPAGDGGGAGGHQMTDAAAELVVRAAPLHDNTLVGSCSSGSLSLPPPASISAPATPLTHAGCAPNDGVHRIALEGESLAHPADQVCFERQRQVARVALEARFEVLVRFNAGVVDAAATASGSGTSWGRRLPMLTHLHRGEACEGAAHAGREKARRRAFGVREGGKKGRS